MYNVYGGSWILKGFCVKWCNSHTSHYVHQFYTDYSVFYFYVVLLPPKKTGWWTANKCPPIYWVICLRCMLRMTRILIPSVISIKKKIKVPALSNQLFFYDSYKHYCGKKNCKILVWRISSYHLNIRIYMLG